MSREISAAILRTQRRGRARPRVFHWSVKQVSDGPKPGARVCASDRTELPEHAVARIRRVDENKPAASFPQCFRLLVK